MQTDLSVDPTRCPLCSQSNQCAGQVERTTGVQQPPCWCNQATFSAELLARVPEHARRQACICVACATAADTGRAKGDVRVDDPIDQSPPAGLPL